MPAVWPFPGPSDRRRLSCRLRVYDWFRAFDDARVPCTGCTRSLVLFRRQGALWLCIGIALLAALLCNRRRTCPPHSWLDRSRRACVFHSLLPSSLLIYVAYATGLRPGRFSPQSGWDPPVSHAGCRHPPHRGWGAAPRGFMPTRVSHTRRFFLG